MVKIQFQDNITKANASTFNTMQDNIENGITDASSTLTTYVDNKFTYSTTETRIGTWIDGKPLYRRVISDTLGTTNGGWKGISITTSNYIKKVVSITGMFEYSNGNDYSIPFFRGTDDSYANREFCLCNINPANGEFAIVARHPSNYSLMSGQPFYAIILYTKTSDY